MNSSSNNVHNVCVSINSVQERTQLLGTLMLLQCLGQLNLLPSVAWRYSTLIG